MEGQRGSPPPSSFFLIRNKVAAPQALDETKKSLNFNPSDSSFQDFGPKSNGKGLMVVAQFKAAAASEDFLSLIANHGGCVDRSNQGLIGEWNETIKLEVWQSDPHPRQPR